jgi:hypothetical protein
MGCIKGKSASTAVVAICKERKLKFQKKKKKKKKIKK